jgi:hypothetical protein
MNVHWGKSTKRAKESRNRNFKQLSEQSIELISIVKEANNNFLSYEVPYIIKAYDWIWNYRIHGTVKYITELCKKFKPTYIHPPSCKFT